MSAPAGGAGRARSALAAVLLLGVLAQLPALFAGFYADDYVLGLALGEAGRLMPMRPWSLFDFGSRADWAPFEEVYGSLPWWTSPDWSVRFLRPIASLSTALDHAVWGGRAIGHHLTSLLLWVVLLALAHRMYGALGLSRGVALLGTALLALGDAAVLPAGWPANRNSVLEGVFAVAALTVARRGAPRKPAMALAIALAVLAALCKESGAIALVLVAWTFISLPPTEGTERRRAQLGACAALGTFCAYFAFLALAGYGTHSLFYATPWREPLRCASNLALLAAGSSISLAGPWPIDLAVAAPQTANAFLIAGVVIGAPLWIWVARSLRSLPGPARSGALILGLWTVLFLLPQAGAVPGDRLLLVPSIGACGLLALHLAALRERWKAGGLGVGVKLAALTLLASATLGSGALALIQGAWLVRRADHFRTTALATDVGPLGEETVHVLVVQTESQLQGFTLGETWHGEGGAAAVQFSLLQNGPRPLRWTRVSANAMELESLGEPFLSGPFERVYLAREPELEDPAAWRTSLFEVRAVPHPSGALRRLRFTFARSLDEPDLRFVAPRDGVLTRLMPPAIGASVELPAPVPSLPYVP